MDTNLSIAGAYIGMQQSQIQNDVQISLLRKVMDQAQQVSEKLLECMPSASPPHLGNNIDLYI